MVSFHGRTELTASHDFTVLLGREQIRLRRWVVFFTKNCRLGRSPTITRANGEEIRWGFAPAYAPVPIIGLPRYPFQQDDHSQGFP